MDKKVIIFLSCLLIAIPVSSALASFYVPPQKKSVQGIAVTKAVIPTDVVSPTPTLFVLQTATKSAGVSISATPSAGVTSRSPKNAVSEIKATVTMIPTVTLVPPTQSAKQMRTEPTPTIYIYTNVTPTPVAAKPTVVTKQPAISTKPSANSIRIVENPSTVIVNEFAPTQAQTLTPNKQIDTDANLQNSN